MLTLVFLIHNEKRNVIHTVTHSVSESCSSLYRFIINNDLSSLSWESFITPTLLYQSFIKISFYRSIINKKTTPRSRSSLSSTHINLTFWGLHKDHIRGYRFPDRSLPRMTSFSVASFSVVRSSFKYLRFFKQGFR